MSFHEVRLPEDIERGAVGGPQFKTDVVELQSGFEKRNIKWSMPRSSWNIGYGIQDLDNLQTVIDFFYNRKGKAFGFRFKDWSDFKIDNQELDVDGQTTEVQLVKEYVDDQSFSFKKTIKKPVIGTFSMSLNGSSYNPANIDFTTGLITLSEKQDIGIIDARNTNPAEIDFDVAHGLATGDSIFIKNVDGMTELNGAFYQLTVVDSDTITLDGVDATGFSSYTGSGKGVEYPQTDDSLTVTTEFDVPVRFDTDKLDIDVEIINVASAQSITIKEIRL